MSTEMSVQPKPDMNADKIDLAAFKKLSFADKKRFREEWRAEASLQRQQAKRLAPLEFETLAEGKRMVVVRAEDVRLAAVEKADLEVVFVSGGQDVLVVNLPALMALQLSREISNRFPADVVEQLRKIVPFASDIEVEPTEVLPVDIGEVTGALYSVRGSMVDFVLFPAYAAGVDPFLAAVVDVPVDALLAWGDKLKSFSDAVPEVLMRKNVVRVKTSP